MSRIAWDLYFHNCTESIQILATAAAAVSDFWDWMNEFVLIKCEYI